MNRTATLSLHTGILILLFVCIADCLFLKDTDHSRHKRGFRMNAGSRLAHGYGKRDYRSQSTDSLYNDETELSSSQSSRHLAEVRRKFLDALENDDTSSLILSTKEFSKLLQTNDELAEVIVRKFIDINDDNMISSDELFRRVRE